jgi:uncharacterized damage-inducible protein DinB
MKSRAVVTLVLLVPVLFFASDAVAAPPGAAGEYSKHFTALSKLSMAVAEAMPPEQYSFRPHPDSMNFGQLMLHLATTNYQFCAGFKDSEPPAMKSPADTDKVTIVKFLGDSFEYCTAVISNATEEQMSKTHSSPDGRLSGREVLLAMYVHVAHHRGQAEIYLRDKGIKPPSYRV